ncbi:hypothetical protein TraAM80_01722 [Trypanosoma rangeli]|uniref:Uncharacterized protein n=1 Tax=Trypanosoma rangeli TaxID=5698 RepID=A0A3R7MYT4_TRYRA|nr:uncharacterized protein TraAM80_01722 [Trypanosoma rangeli]RNF10146.1 hypothetical protein TraAM80_01722 [Trypanosoma rangeli]|eukprot:RNF10146.1 hypothetical protein TraAM80_01722 [Trypanosoma rangeli]
MDQYVSFLIPVSPSYQMNVIDVCASFVVVVFFFLVTSLAVCVIDTVCVYVSIYCQPPSGAVDIRLTQCSSHSPSSRGPKKYFSRGWQLREGSWRYGAGLQVMYVEL